MNQTRLLDLEVHGRKFTWRGHRNGQLVEAWLDRALVNQEWLEWWPNTSVLHCTVTSSDHTPIMIMGEPICGTSRRLFRFEAFWTKEAGCKDIVRSF